MFGIQQLEQLAKSYGLPTAILLIAVAALALVVVHLYRENNRLHTSIETLLDERGKVLEGILAGRIETRRFTAS